MSHNAVFGYAFVPSQLPDPEVHKSLLKAFHILERDCGDVFMVITWAYDTQVKNPWYRQIGSPQWLMAQNEFRIKITRRIRNRIRKKFCECKRSTNGVD
jgi:hypothetical protein